MNERIKQLAEQAREKKFDYRAREGESHYIYVLNVEKFAELIVLKCAEIADTAEPFLASDLIKQHFGIEE